MNSISPNARPSITAKSPYLLLSLAILVLDQWSKWLVEENLSAASRVEVIPDLLNFIHVQNTGVAFGLFASHGERTGTLLLAGLGLLALAFVFYYFLLTPLWDRLLLISLGLVLGGAVGNLVDRIAQGAVTDFIDFYFGTYHWHTFNIADSAITIGISLMLISAFRAVPEDKLEGAGDAEDLTEGEPEEESDGEPKEEDDAQGAPESDAPSPAKDSPAEKEPAEGQG